MATINAVAKEIVQYEEPDRLGSVLPTIFVCALLEGAEPEGLDTQQLLNAQTAALSAALNSDPAVVDTMNRLRAAAIEKIAQELEASRGADKEVRVGLVSDAICQVFGM